MNRIESTEIDQHEYSQLIFDETEKAIQWIKRIFSTNDAGTGYSHKKIINKLRLITFIKLT